MPKKKNPKNIPPGHRIACPGALFTLPVCLLELPVFPWFFR
jgi:hypothetical protein